MQIYILIMIKQLDNYYLVKYIIIGSPGIGKTSMAEYYVNRRLTNSDTVSTVGIEFFPKKIKYEDKTIIIHIWDTAGQEQYNSIVKQYYREPHGVFICFSLINRYSFDRLDNYLNEIKCVNDKNAQYILIGTFSDQIKRRRVVEKNEIMEYAKKHNMKYMEISSKTGDNIDECFEMMNKVMHERINNKDSSILYVSNKVDNNLSNNGYCCKLT